MLDVFIRSGFVNKWSFLNYSHFVEVWAAVFRDSAQEWRLVAEVQTLTADKSAVEAVNRLI